MNSDESVGVKITTETKSTEEQLEIVIKKLTTMSRTLTNIKKNTGIESVNTDLKETNSTLKDINSSLKLPNLSSLLSMLRSISSYFTDAITSTSDYLENLNLLDTAYGNSAESAESFVNTISDAFGLNESTISRQLGYYRQIGNALGYDSDTAELLASNLQKLQLDMASLYNLSFDRAGEVLQASLAGQTKPIRGATGGDITQNSLQQKLDDLDIDASITDLSRAEKALLIYLQIEDQVEESEGDLSKTINSTANQLKILSNQWERLGTAVGSTVKGAFDSILPVINGVLMVMVELVNMFATLVGFEIPDYDTQTYVDISDYLDDIEESASSASKSLRGFDKLNNIKTPTSSSGSGTDSSSIYDQLIEKLEEYDLHMDSLANKATQVRDAIEDWLGITDGTYKKLKLIGIALGTIVGYKLISKASSLLKILGSSGIGKVLTTMYTAVKVLGGKDGLTYLFLLAKEGATKFLKVGVKAVAAVAGIATAINGSSGAYNAMKNLATESGNAALNIADTGVSITAATAGGVLAGSVFGPLGMAIGGVAGAAISATSAFFGWNSGIKEIVNENLFGDLSISVSEWTDILTNSGPELTNYSDKLEELNTTLSNQYSTFKTNMDTLELYGYKFGILSKQISDEDATNIKNAIKDMCESSSTIIQEATDFDLTLWGDTFSNMSTMTEDEEKAILNSIVSYGDSQQTELKTAQDNITTTYDNAIKTRGYLTDEEYNYIQTQLAKIKTLTQKEMSENQTNIEYYKRLYADKNLQLDKESYAAFAEALNAYQTEQKALIEENYNVQSNSAKKMLDNQEITLEQYNALIDTATEQRKQDTESLKTYIEDTQKEIYTDLADIYNKVYYETDSASKKTKSIIEDIFKDINVDASNIISQFASVGERAGEAFSSNFSARGSVELTTGGDYGGGHGFATGVYDVPEDGWFRASKGEYFGKFDDGTTYIANNKQITDGIRQSTMNGMMDAIVAAGLNGKQNVSVNIVAEETGSILDNIKFKEQQRSRQYDY